MKKIYYLMAFFAIAAFVGCENDDDENPNSAKEQQVSHADSVKVHVFCYDKYLTPTDVFVTKSDTSQISVSTTLIEKLNNGTPKKGNVVVVWNKKTDVPYYLRVKETSKSEDRLLLNVDKATAFEALPDGEYKFSTDVFCKPTLMSTQNGEINEKGFYDEADSTYHPIVIIETKNTNLTNDNDVECIDRSVSMSEKIFEESGFIDVREFVTSNYTYDATVINFDKTFRIGVIPFPGLGKSVEGVHGGWLDLFGGMEKLKKAGGVEGFGTSFKAYAKIDSIRMSSKLSVHVDVRTSWMRPVYFEASVKKEGDFEVSNIGFGIGAGFSGEKQLTHFPSHTFVFWIGVVPVAIEVAPDIFFKYNVEAYGILDYPLLYKSHSTSTAGLRWEKDKGIKDLSSSKDDSDYNKSSSFSDFVNKSRLAFHGNASAGVYLRTRILFYNLAGPTLGIGGRFDLSAEVGQGKQINDDGEWISSYEAISGDYAKLSFAVAGEVGAEVSILGKSLFNRAWDVYDFKTYPIFSY